MHDLSGAHRSVIFLQGTHKHYWLVTGEFGDLICFYLFILFVWFGFSYAMFGTSNFFILFIYFLN